VPADTCRVRQVLCPVLAGRGDGTAHLRAALAAAQAGRGGTVLVTGEAGVGKSRPSHDETRAARTSRKRSAHPGHIGQSDGPPSAVDHIGNQTSPAKLSAPPPSVAPASSG
jgi:hypothetical protein